MLERKKGALGTCGSYLTILSIYLRGIVLIV